MIDHQIVVLEDLYLKFLCGQFAMWSATRAATVLHVQQGLEYNIHPAECGEVFSGFIVQPKKKIIQIIIPSIHAKFGLVLAQNWTQTQPSSWTRI